MLASYVYKKNEAVLILSSQHTKGVIEVKEKISSLKLFCTTTKTKRVSGLCGKIDLLAGRANVTGLLGLC